MVVETGSKPQTKRKKDSRYYSKIGQKGGAKTRDARGYAFFVEIGRKGGKKRSENWTKRNGSEGTKETDV
mgnify:CR=1 FL=1